MPGNLDAAMVWSGNDKIYFFKGSKYWRFNPKQQPPIDEAYPKPLRNWEGLPGRIDAALQYENGKTYFFRGEEYYRWAMGGGGEVGTP